MRSALLVCLCFRLFANLMFDLLLTLKKSVRIEDCVLSVLFYTLNRLDGDLGFVKGNILSLPFLLKKKKNFIQNEVELVFTTVILLLNG